MEVTPTMRGVILNGSQIDIRDAAQEAGFISLTRQAVELVFAGELSVHEAYRVCTFDGR
jgi:type II secretory ATPase GspE/PulE/Tfp pilus assembly ATPase PilB-like protein